MIANVVEVLPLASSFLADSNLDTNSFVWTSRIYVSMATVMVQFPGCCPTIDKLQLLCVKDVSYKETCCSCGYCGIITVHSTEATGEQSLSPAHSDYQVLFAVLVNSSKKVRVQKDEFRLF